jgi:16S rRNA (uracil1498-N3)-methyltransferase
MKPSDHFLFYSSRIENGEVFLDKEEARHVFFTLRKSANDPIMVTDGKGALYECSISERTEDSARCMVKKTVSVPLPRQQVRACIGLPDKDAFEQCAENLSALGASEIVPMECEYCQDHWWKGWDKQSPRIAKKMIAGIKQAKCAWLPKCNPPKKLSAAIEGCKGSLMLVADDNGVLFADVIERIKNTEAVSCFVGPPGGFSPKEMEALKSSGAVSVSLSRNRLRTELAATILCGMVKSIK